MASNFVPLLRESMTSQSQAAPSAPAFRPLAPQSQGASPSKGPLGDPLALAAALGLLSKADTASAGGPANAPHTHQQMTPVVTARKEGDRITHLIVRCPCGSVTEIECLY